jgi:hypothetical protein
LEQLRVKYNKPHWLRTSGELATGPYRKEEEEIMCEMLVLLPLKN